MARHDKYLIDYIKRLKEAAGITARDNIQTDYGSFMEYGYMPKQNMNKQTVKPTMRVLCQGCKNNGYACARCHGEGYIEILTREYTAKTVRMYKFCHSCGDELPENAYYCIMCGKQIRNIYIYEK